MIFSAAEKHREVAKTVVKTRHNTRVLTWNICAASICTRAAAMTPMNELKEIKTEYSAHTLTFPLSFFVFVSLHCLFVFLKLIPSALVSFSGRVVRRVTDTSGCLGGRRLAPALMCVSSRRDREHVREGAVHPEDPAGRPEGHAGGDALPVRLPQPVSIHSHKSRPSHLMTTISPELVPSSHVVLKLGRGARGRKPLL